jgi:hypothetical protein
VSPHLVRCVRQSVRHSAGPPPGIPWAPHVREWALAASPSHLSLLPAFLPRLHSSLSQFPSSPNLAAASEKPKNPRRPPPRPWPPPPRSCHHRHRRPRRGGCRRTPPRRRTARCPRWRRRRRRRRAVTRRSGRPGSGRTWRGCRSWASSTSCRASPRPPPPGAAGGRGRSPWSRGP